MKTIIAGSRSVLDYNILITAIKNASFAITSVISGTAKGADQLGERYAYSNGIKVEKFPPDWKKYKKQAGVIRNIEMAKNAEALIALWDGKSKGTKHMIDIAKKKGLKVHIEYIDYNPKNKL